MLADGDDPAVLQAERAQLQHKPSAVEASANQKSLEIIRKLYGSRAQTIINALLAFDAYFAWYYPFKKSVPYGDMGEREQRALENCRTAIDMQEIFERVSIRSHLGSFLPHISVFKVSHATFLSWQMCSASVCRDWSCTTRTSSGLLSVALHAASRYAIRARPERR